MKLKPHRPVTSIATVAASFDEVARLSSPEHAADEAEALARSVLEEAALPFTMGRFVRWPERVLQPCPGTLAEARQAVADGGEIVTLADVAGRHDIHGRAARTIVHVIGLRKALAASDTINAAQHAFGLGQEAILLELELKGWLRAVAAGEGTSRGGRKGGTAKRDTDPQANALKKQVIAEAKIRLAGNMHRRKTQVARDLAARHGLNESNIRDWLKKLA